MSHVIREKKKINLRIKKIKGQLSAIERGLEEGADCYEVLQTLAAAKGAVNGLFAELLEMHIKEHIMDNPDLISTKKDKGAIELIKLMKTFWK